MNIPPITIPNFRPKCSKSIPVFRPKQLKNHTLWGGTPPRGIYQLSYQAIWELVTLWICNTPVEGEEDKWLCERSYIWTREKNMKWWSIITVINHDHPWLHILCSSNIRSFICSFAQWLVFLQLPVSSVGRASDYQVGGLGFEPQTGPTLRVLK